MKKIVFFALFIVVFCTVWLCGCTGTAPQKSGTTGSQGSQQVATVVTTAPAGISAATTSARRVIIDEQINLWSGEQTTYQKYAFEDFGYRYLYPNDAFSISVNSDKPVNVLVIDKDDEIKFPSIEPEWNTVLERDQWDYSPVVPVFSQSNVLRKDMTFRILDKSSYFIIIDPRFASDQAGWRSSRHDEVHVDVKVTKL